MSNDSEIRVSKSVLSPHVAEFIPSFAKTFNQDAAKHPTTPVVLEEKPARKTPSLHPEVEDRKPYNNPKHFEKSRKPFAQNYDYEKQPISSWRRPDHCEESRKSTNPSKQKDNFTISDRNNWRYRENERTDDSDRVNSRVHLRSEVTRNDSTRGEEVLGARRKPVSFQTSLRSNSNSTQDQSRIVHRGFGRGRGRPRNAWTDDHGQRGKDFKILPSESTPSGTPGYGRGQGVSYSDKLKGAGTELKADLQSHKTQMFENRDRVYHDKPRNEFHGRKTQVFESNDEVNKVHREDIKSNNNDNEWTKVGKKEQENLDKECKINSKEHTTKERIKAKAYNNTESMEGRKGQLGGKWRVDRDDRNAIENKEFTNKSRWKGTKVDTDTKSVQNLHSYKQERLSTSNINNPLENREISLKMPGKAFTQMKTTESTNKSKKIKLLTKDIESNDITESNDMFELVQNESEFPDLGKASVKSSESSSLASDWLSGGSKMPIISYSAVLKTIPKPQPRQQSKSSTTSGNSGQAVKGSDGEPQTKKKKKKKKKKAKDNNKDPEKPEQQLQQSPKKTKQPMQLDLGDWLSALEKPSKPKSEKQSSKKVTIATGVLQIKLQSAVDARSAVGNQPSNAKPMTTHKGLHNILDSTAPVVKRGKERENPKKKKPSPLKKIILKEREEKKKALDGEQQDDENTEENINENGSEETNTGEPSLEGTEEEISIASSDTRDDPLTSGVPSEEDIKAQIHSRRFREYCDNVMDKELNKTTTELLQKLVIFQDRQYHKDPVKSKAKRRFVVGLREVTKHLKLKKIKLVIISPNVERIKSAGGLDDTLHNIITIAHQNGVPVVFALRRQILGRILHKKVPVSAIGVFNYDGAQDQFKELMDLTEKARSVYAERWKKAYDELMEQIQQETKELDNEQLEKQQGEVTNQDNDVQEDSSSSDENDDNSEYEDTTSVDKDNLVTEKPDHTDCELDEQKGDEENAPSIDTDMNVEDL